MSLNFKIMGNVGLRDFPWYTTWQSDMDAIATTHASRADGTHTAHAASGAEGTNTTSKHDEACQAPGAPEASLPKR